MHRAAFLGPSIHVTGEVSADEPLVIAGRVDGTITLTNHALTVEAGGQIHADVVAGSIVISGNATGSLNASARIVVHGSAVVEGSLSAPGIAVVDGAQVQGTVEAGQRRTALPMAS